MGVPLPIIIMIAMMMLMFGVSVIIIMKKKIISLHKQLIQSLNNLRLSKRKSSDEIPPLYLAHPIL